jgi:hypothetical protein
VKVRIECRLRERAVREKPWRLNIEIQYGRATGTSRLIMPWEDVGVFGSDRRKTNTLLVATPDSTADYERRAVGGDKPIQTKRDQTYMYM